ncbi:MAG: esterase/lipase family protein [Rhizobacter sp.]
MIAHSQKMIAILWLVAPVVWFRITAGHCHPVLVGLGMAFLLLAHSIVLAIEFAFLHRQHHRHPIHPTRACKLVRVWLVESVISLRVFLWDQAFRSRAVSDDLLDSAGRRSVLLIHGYVCNRGFWNPWMRRLRSLRIPYCAITMEPPFGTIDEAIEAIDIAVRAATRATGLAPLVVTHSMGALSLRAWMRKYSADARIHHVVTIASPNQGTWLARFAASRNARQIRIGSSWLKNLERDEPPARYRRFTCFYGNCDNVVFPMELATLPGADNRHVDSAAHIQMALQEEVFREAIRLLDAPAVSVC